MILEAIRLFLTTAILVVLPGWLLLHALFPRRQDLTWPEQVYWILAGGVLVLMCVGIVLGFLPHGSKGALQSLALGGMPNVELATTAVCLGLTWIGLQRGAYPWLEARLPTGWRPREKAPQRAQAP